MMKKIEILAFVTLVFGVASFLFLGAALLLGSVKLFWIYGGCSLIAISCAMCGKGSCKKLRQTLPVLLALAFLFSCRPHKQRQQVADVSILYHNGKHVQMQVRGVKALDSISCILQSDTNIKESSIIGKNLKQPVWACCVQGDESRINTVCDTRPLYYGYGFQVTGVNISIDTVRLVEVGKGGRLTRIKNPLFADSANTRTIVAE